MGRGVKATNPPASSASIQVRLEREEVEVTRSGILPPFEPDYQRVFVPGLSTYYVTVDGVELPPMTPEQYGALAVLLPETS